MNKLIFSYIDKKGAAVNVLKDYENMKSIIDNNEQELAEKREQMYSLGSVSMDGLPHAHDPLAGQNRVVRYMDDIDYLMARYEDARLYMLWVEPALNALTAEEKYVLLSFYSNNNGRGDYMVSDIGAKLSLGRQAVYNRKNRALEKFATLLFRTRR